MTKLTSNMFTFYRQDNGQAMTEFCVAAPVLVLLLWGILYLTQMYIVKHETLVAARYGTWLLSRYDNTPKDRVDFEQVNGLIAKHFFKNDTDNLTVTPQHVDGNEDDSGFSDKANQRTEPVGWADQMIGFFAEHLVGSDTPIIYSLNVQYDYPRLFGPVDLREGDNDHFSIQSEHFVVGNSWDGQRVDVHDLVDIVKEVISDIIDAL